MLNEATIRQWWDIFVKEYGFTEVRILGRFQYSGYFNNVDSLINAIKPYAEMDDEQIYFVLNKIDNACYGRQQSGKIIKSPKITTNDNDIVRRCFVFVDFDPIRKSGTNASDEEYKLAHKKAQEVFVFLRKQGFSEPIISKSGNGLHLTYKVDFPTDDETTQTIKRFYEYLAKQFSDEKVDIDAKVFNLARLCKLYGTVAKKGANLQDRPWRMSEIIYVPKEIKTTEFEKFTTLANLLPQDVEQSTRAKRTNPYRQAFDLVDWMNEHGIKFREKKSGSSTLYELYECPWIDQHSDHKNWDSALFVDVDGKITFNCTHSHCKDKTWFDVRVHYEPDAYNKPIYNNQNQWQQAKPKQRKYEIKGEIPELGKKWLTMSSIKKIDLSKMEGVKTGFTELDRSIVKLHYGEVTVLSGSNAAGKSSWLNNLILNIVNQGVPTALWSGELPEPILKAWLQMVAAGKNNLRLSQYNDGKYYVPSNIGERIDKWMDDKLFIYNTEYGNQWEQLLADMEEMFNAGIKVFVLDNLMAMNVDLISGDKNEKQKQVILKIKEFAKKKNVHLILVAHPRKTTAFLRKNDISGTSDLQNAVDKIFIIHRVNNDFFRAGAEFFGQNEIQRWQGYGNVIEVCKDRLYGVVDFMVGMHYEIESRRFKNTVDENIKYGWELEPTQSNIDFEKVKQHYTPTYEAQTASDDMPFGVMPTDSEAPF